MPVCNSLRPIYMGIVRICPIVRSFIPANLANGCDLVATYFPSGVRGTPEYEDYFLLERLDENSTQWSYYVGN